MELYRFNETTQKRRKKGKHPLRERHWRLKTGVIENKRKLQGQMENEITLKIRLLCGKQYYDGWAVGLKRKT